MLFEIVLSKLGRQGIFLHLDGLQYFPYFPPLNIATSQNIKRLVESMDGLMFAQSRPRVAFFDAGT
jgi:hypothetical protein